MKRQDIVNKLLKEGFSEKTLVNFSDKQLEKLSGMIVSETLNIHKDDKQAIDKAKMDKKSFDTYEGDMSEEDDVNEKKEEDIDENTDFMKKQHINTGFKGVDKKLLRKNSIVEWVEKLAERKYTNLTLKKEIMEMVTTKIEQHEEKRKVKKGHNGIPEFMTYDAIKSNAPVKEPTTKPAEPTTKPGTRPRKTPYQPGPGINPRPKAMGKNKLK